MSGSRGIHAPRRGVVGLLLLMVWASPAIADAADGAPVSRDELEVLQHRIAALEDSVEAIAARDVIEDVDAEAAHEELIALRSRLSRLPRINGYYDFEFFDEDAEDSPAYFRHHHFTLLVSREFDDWRLFGEIEYENGTLIEGDGDPVGEVVRGAVKLEQAWIEKSIRDALVLRAGLMLTPAQSVIRQWPILRPTTRRPRVFGLYPEKQIGLAAHGRLYGDAIGLDYMAYVSNGQSKNAPRRDDNSDKAIGARVGLDLSEALNLRQLQVAVNGYRENPQATGRYDLWAAELLLEAGRFQLWSEFVDRIVAHHVQGAYVQPLFEVWGPWSVLYRYDWVSEEGLEDLEDQTLGICYRAHQNVTLKFEVYRVEQKPAPSTRGIAASIAVGF